MTTTEKTPAEIRAEVSDAMNSAVAELEACKTDDEIFAWPYGLAVGIAANGNAYAASLDKAATAADVLWPVRNGAGLTAERIRRQEAIRLQLIELRRIIADHLPPA